MSIKLTALQKKWLIGGGSVLYAVFLSIGNYPKGGFLAMLQGLMLFAGIWMLGAWFAEVDSTELREKTEELLDKLEAQEKK